MSPCRADADKPPRVTLEPLWQGLIGPWPGDDQSQPAQWLHCTGAAWQL